MDKFSAHQVINDTWGEIWIDGTYMAEVTAFKAKVTLDKTDVNMTRRLAKVQKVIGYSCTGQITLNKVSSFFIKKLSDDMKAGKQTVCTIISKLDDPDSNGAERVVIKEAYESAGSQNGKRYCITMKQGELCVDQVGDEVIEYTLRADTNIIESSYSENAEGVINKVKIYDEGDQYLGAVQNNELISLVGTFQDVHTREDGKQAKASAQSMLKGISQEISVTVKGNTSCISGKTIKIEDSLTKLVGSCYVESDEHVWDNGQYRTTMELNF